MILDRFGTPIASRSAVLAAQESWGYNGFDLGANQSSYASFNPFHVEGQELPRPLDFEGLSDALYRKNAIAYSCIRKLSASASEPEFIACTIDKNGVAQRDDPYKDPLAKLIAQPNQQQEAYEFFEQLVIHLQATGNAFVRKIRTRAKGVHAIELLRPDLMTITPMRTRGGGRAARYTYEGNSAKPEEIPLADMIHLRLPDVFDEFWGLSPLYVLMKYGDIDVQATDFLRSYFLNRGVPSGMLVVDGRIQDPDRQALKDSWRRQYQGGHGPDRAGWHGVAVLDQGVRYEQLSSGLRDIKLDPIFDQSETRICMVFGVPPILVGTASGLQRSTHSNFSESRRSFWTDTLIPMYTRVVRRLTKRLAIEDFGPRRVVKADVEKVAGIQENKDKLRMHAIRGWDKGLFTVNEARSLMDMPPLPEEQQGNAVKLGTQSVYVPRDQASQFADLTGDVITDVVQNEILETEEDRIAGVGDPNPAIGKPDRTDPVEQKVSKAKKLEEEAKRLRKEAKQEKKDKEAEQDDEERAVANTRETLSLFNADTGDCLAHGEFACRTCQDAIAHEDDTLDAAIALILDGDQDALDEFLTQFPENFHDTLRHMVDRIVGGDCRQKTGASFLRTIPGVDLRPIMSMFTMILALEGEGKTDDEIRSALFNAKSRLEEDALR